MVVIPTKRPEHLPWMDEPDRPVTQGMRNWQQKLADNEAHISPQAADWAAEQIKLMARGGYVRAGRLSPSGLHTCPRAQMLSYAGNKGHFPEANHVLMEMGTWSHLRWQVAGLSEGFLHKAEVIVKNATIDDRIWGHIDGLVMDGSGFELKTTSENNYANIRVRGPSDYHLHQVGVYMVLTGLDLFSLVYEARDSGEFHEVRVHPADVDTGAITKRIDTMLEWSDKYDDNQTLPPVKPLCAEGKGKEYQSCPLKSICLPSGPQHSMPGGAT